MNWSCCVFSKESRIWNRSTHVLDLVKDDSPESEDATVSLWACDSVSVGIVAPTLKSRSSLPTSKWFFQFPGKRVCSCVLRSCLSAPIAGPWSLTPRLGKKEPRPPLPPSMKCLELRKAASEWFDLFL